MLKEHPVLANSIITIVPVDITWESMEVVGSINTIMFLRMYQYPKIETTEDFALIYL